jgi:tRNA pseudouridine38-40 synthase
MEQIKQRYKITVEYEGTDYCGFQRQPDIEQKTIEEVLEKAALDLTGEKVKIVSAGRTDGGVHALGQVAHFDLEKNFDPKVIVSGMNNYLRQEAVCVLKCEKVEENFHARLSAKMRHYRYEIINRRAPLTLKKNRAWHVSKDLDLEAMKRAAQVLLGEHDFTSFRDAECQASSPFRSIDKIEFIQNGEEILIEVSARSFLHHMVRNIMGALIQVGQGREPLSFIDHLLTVCDRTQGAPTFSPDGLYLTAVKYPGFKFPDIPNTFFA